MTRLVSVAACVVVAFGCGVSDNDPPAAPIVDPIETPTPQTVIRVTGTAEFGSTVRLTGGTAPAESIADPYTARWFATVSIANGPSTLSVTATDAAGNVSPATEVTVTQVASGTPESITLLLGQASANVGEPVPFSVVALDTFGDPVSLASLTVTTTDALAMVDVPGRTIRFGTVGTPLHTVTATLLGGTPAAASDTAVILVTSSDSQAPDVTIQSPASGSLAPGATVTVTVRASDAGGLAQILLQAFGETSFFEQRLVPRDATTGLAETGPITASFVVGIPRGALGTVTLVAQAIDTSGNASSSAAVTIPVDPARSIVVGPGVTVTTVSGRGQLRRPRGVAVDAANLVYVTNNDSNFPLILRMDPTMPPLANQTVFALPQPGRNGEDLVFVDNAAGTDFFFVSTAGGGAGNRIARVDSAGAVLQPTWSADLGVTPRGLVVESPTSIAAIYSDRRVRRFNPTSAGPNTAPTSSMNASNNLGNAWGLELLSFGCPANQFLCGDGSCISNTQVCNGTANCAGGTDEASCSAVQQLRCANPLFSTPATNICNGVDDCTDNSDERSCRRYAATDFGSVDEAWAFYDSGNGATTAFDLRIASQLNQPRGIAMSPSGRFVYVANSGGREIIQIDANHIFDRTPCDGACPVVASNFNEAWGLAFDGSGRLLVTDHADDLVYRVTGLP